VVSQTSEPNPGPGGWPVPYRRSNNSSSNSRLHISFFAGAVVSAPATARQAKPTDAYGSRANGSYALVNPFAPRIVVSPETLTLKVASSLPTSSRASESYALANPVGVQGRFGTISLQKSTGFPKSFEGGESYALAKPKNDGGKLVPVSRTLQQSESYIFANPIFVSPVATGHPTSFSDSESYALAKSENVRGWRGSNWFKNALSKVFRSSVSVDRPEGVSGSYAAVNTLQPIVYTVFSSPRPLLIRTRFQCHVFVVFERLNCKRGALDVRTLSKTTSMLIPLRGP